MVRVYDDFVIYERIACDREGSRIRYRITYRICMCICNIRSVCIEYMRVGKERMWWHGMVCTYGMCVYFHNGFTIDAHLFFASALVAAASFADASGTTYDFCRAFLQLWKHMFSNLKLKIHRFKYPRLLKTRSASGFWRRCNCLHKHTKNVNPRIWWVHVSNWHRRGHVNDDT